MLLVGNGNTGKTSYAKVLREVEIFSSYVATLGVEVHPVRKGTTTFNVWDTAGQPALLGIKEGYYSRSQCCMVFCDNTPRSVESIPDHIREVKRICGDIPIVIVRNKSDLAESPGDDTLTIDEEEYKIFNVSCKYSLGIMEPLLYLESKLSIF